MSLLVAIRLGIRRMSRPFELGKITYTTNQGQLKNGNEIVQHVHKLGDNRLTSNIDVPNRKSIIRCYVDNGPKKNLMNPFGGIILQKFYFSAHSSSRSAGPIETENSTTSHETAAPERETDKDEVIETSTIVTTGVNPSLATAEPSSSSPPLPSAPLPPLQSLPPSPNFSPTDFQLTNQLQSLPTSESFEKPPESQTSDETNTNTNSVDNNQPPDIKLPSREQVEKYLYMAAVIIWDTTLYIYAISRKIIEQYVLKNPTFDHYWRIFINKFNETRKEMKK